MAITENMMTINSRMKILRITTIIKLSSKVPITTLSMYILTQTYLALAIEKSILFLWLSILTSAPA